jgi:hypothetical protein
MDLRQASAGQAAIVEADMITRTFQVYGGGIVLLILGVTTPAASGQTPLPRGLEITLLPGFIHEPLRGIDSIVGKIGKKDGLQITYTMGPLPKEWGRRTSGHFVNAALGLPEKDRLWLKEQNAGGRKVHVVYSKEYGLIVSSVSATEGVNFSAMARSPGEVADVLLMALTLAERKPKRDK